MNSNVEPPSFSSLPDEIIVSCLARISRSYYPTLSLVSKTFHSLILSDELSQARIVEKVLYVCLQLPDCRLPSWFSLWIKPDQTLTNDQDNKSNGNTLLVPVPSSYDPLVPSTLDDWIGSKYYDISKDDDQTSSSLVMWVGNGRTNTIWYEAPGMKVTREYNAVAGFLDGKIYVMGGCNGAESTDWAEVFDLKTETWESLPDPGRELRYSLIKELKVKQGKIYVSSNADIDYVYDPKEDKWDVISKEEVFVKRFCAEVMYGCTTRACYWIDTKSKEWRFVKGLEDFFWNCHGGFITFDIIISGKLFIIWDKSDDDSQNKNKKILCSVIALARRNNNDEVWGNVERTNVVLTVPSSYVFLRCKVMEV